jgi:uncharacterized protein YjeT (DUF2065 family)
MMFFDKRRTGPVLLALLGIGSVLNGLWMLATPITWYVCIPAALADFGAPNAHLVRDVGCGFLAVGTGMLWAAHQPAHARPLIVVAALFYGAHALVHVWDTGTGVVGPWHWLIDLPLTYLPAILLLVLLMRRPFWR